MKNDYKFWNDYLIRIKKEIIKLCNSKKDVYIDFHIHSNYSADGKQSLEEIISNARKHGFDIISITDHDSLKVYDELFYIVKERYINPIIVPGIEFTIDNNEYGNQCHFLQLFINPKDSTLLKDVNKNYNAMFNRSKIQFKRLKQNKAIIDLAKKFKIKFYYSEYIKYLDLNKKIPEYETLCDYLMQKFKMFNITNFEILDSLEKYNNLDIYDDRKNYKKARFDKLRKKYPVSQSNAFNSHFLLSMLAVREVDDDWWPSPSSGSLSVNSYGQLKIEELNNKFVTFWAHPSESKLKIVDKNIKKFKNIIGLEQNIRNEYKNLNDFNNILLENKLFKIIGSDTHDGLNVFYKDMSFYRIKSSKLKEIVIGDKNGKD